MKREFLHIAMYRALDCLYDEKPTKNILQFLTDANPYIYSDRTTADPAVQADFNKSMDRQNIRQEIDEEISYFAVKNFLAGQNKNFARMFEKISLDEWKKLCEIVSAEEELTK
ncbi:MAG: hypothetical protein IK062_08190 [Selenomonadaceae bacterium]|nr:hypothetical protein [Selenomonadaceae bacterium]